MSAQAYDVYKVQYKLGMQDLLMPPGIRYHTVIFIHTDADGGGRVLHVTDSISYPNGMRFEEKLGRYPNDSETFHAKIILGKIRVSDYPNVVQLLRTVDPPPCQRAFNTVTLQTALRQSGLLRPPGVSIQSSAQINWVWDEAARRYRYYDGTNWIWKP